MTTTGDPVRATRLDSLTSLRAVAALAVFGIHAAHWFPGPLRPVVAPGGDVGVAFFFILSGVVLAWTMRPGDRAGQFYRRRFARIAPSYWVAALLAVPVLAIAGALTAGELVRMLPSLAFVQSWSPDPDIYYAGNGVGWSLSTEAFFYLTFPIFAPALARLRAGALRWVAVAAAVCAMALPPVLAHLTSESTSTWLSGVFPPVRLLEFVLGVCLGLLLRRGALPSVSLPAAAVVTVAAYGVVTQVPNGLWRTVLVLPLAALLVAAAQSDLAGRSTVLHRRPFVALGEWSFCFYLVHQLVIKVVHQLIPTDGEGIAGHALRTIVMLATLGLAVVAAAALHRLVEVPAERRLRPARQAPRAPLSAGTHRA